MDVSVGGFASLVGVWNCGNVDEVGGSSHGTRGEACILACLGVRFRWQCGEIDHLNVHSRAFRVAGLGYGPCRVKWRDFVALRNNLAARVHVDAVDSTKSRQA